VVGDRAPGRDPDEPPAVRVPLRAAGQVNSAEQLPPPGQAEAAAYAAAEAFGPAAFPCIAAARFAIAIAWAGFIPLASSFR